MPGPISDSYKGPDGEVPFTLPDELLEASIGKGLRMGVSDVETNGLVPELDKVHCATWEDLLTGEHLEWNPDNIKEYPEFLMDTCGVVWGHNFKGFDNRAIAKWCALIGIKFDPRKYITMDTLPAVKMVWPVDVLIGPDMKLFHSGKMPGKYLKRQSLAAWGFRLGNYKGEYDGGWEVWNPEMQTYMVQDGKVNLDLVKLILRRIGWNMPSGPHHRDDDYNPGYIWPYLPFWIENEYTAINAEQEEVGVGFDLQQAQAFTADLKNRQAAMTAKLQEAFGAWWAPLDNPEKGRAINRTVVRNCKQFPQLEGEALEQSKVRYTAMTGKKAPRNSVDAGWVKEYHLEGSTHCRVEYTQFNPNSRDHLADRLQRVFKWKPETFTPSGKAQVDESVIESISSTVIDEPTREVILDYFVVTKTLGQLADGNKSWVYSVAPDGAIHGRVDPLGTVTGRGTHFNPNLGQIPAVDVKETKNKAGKVIKKEPIKGLEGRFGYECRMLFIPGGLMQSPPAWRADKVELTGSDVSGLEFVMLGHYLEPHDGGAFRDRVANPLADIHAENAVLATEATGEEMTRRSSKTLGLLIIYGGGAWKAGLGIGVAEEEIPELLLDKGLPNRLRFMRKRLGAAYEEPSPLDKARIVKGAKGIKAIKSAIPGLEPLMADIQEVAKERGYVVALDGRKLYIRKAYSALNTLLQGGGAIACKLWMVLFHKMMREKDYLWRVHFSQVLWVHDEKQNEHIEGLGKVIAETSEAAVKEAGRLLKLRGVLRTESKTGRSWAGTH